jgi:hypothetical protein
MDEEKASSSELSLLEAQQAQKNQQYEKVLQQLDITTKYVK